MMNSRLSLCALAISCVLIPDGPARAADHLEAPIVASDQASDLADVYAFLDPTDNTRVVLAMDVHGFIVPGENANVSGFDSRVLYRFDIENTGDAAPDATISVRFDEQTARSAPQTAHVVFRSKDDHKRRTFDAPTTVASATATESPAPVVTTDNASKISFFAGVTDDPFFFDIPAFNRFAASVLGGSPDVTLLDRGRNTFAGYNIQMIALRVPVSMLKGSAGDVIGVSATTLRNAEVHYSRRGDPNAVGRFVPIDRMGVPAINTVLIPFARKNEYNRATPQQDAAGRFAGDIVATLTALGTDPAHIGILADVAVTRGDYLRLSTSIPNMGSQGGTNGSAGFPNGRRPADDVVDTVLFLVTNEQLTTGDNVDANDVAFRDTFPFFAPSHQPFAAGVIDDFTRN